MFKRSKTDQRPQQINNHNNDYNMAAAIGKNVANDDMSDDMAPAKGKFPPEKSLQAENGGMIENAVKISIKDQVCCLNSRLFNRSLYSRGRLSFWV
jgi:hypothetical protein